MVAIDKVTVSLKVYIVSMFALLCALIPGIYWTASSIMELNEKMSGIEATINHYHDESKVISKSLAELNEKCVDTRTGWV